MKLRLLDDSLRLRVSQGDLATLAECGRVAGRTHFAEGAPALIYSLNVAPDIVAAIATFAEGEVRVSVPKAAAQRWIESDQVGISADQKVVDGRILTLLIEKDFRCVIPRPGEEDYDGFPNPDAEC